MALFRQNFAVPARNVFLKWATQNQIPTYELTRQYKPTTGTTASTVYVVAPSWQYESELHREVDTHKYYVWVKRGCENELSEGDKITLGDTQHIINEIGFLYGSKKGYITVH